MHCCISDWMTKVDNYHVEGLFTKIDALNRYEKLVINGDLAHLQ